jgi:hypothetical protein
MAATAGVEPAHEPTKTGSPLLDRLWHAARARGDSAPTADRVAALARRFNLFHDRRHPRELGLAHVTHFLEHVAKTEREPLPALAQARAALALLYEHVVGADLGELPWPRPPRVLDQLRLLLRVRHYSRSTEDGYVQWARRFMLFHRVRQGRCWRYQSARLTRRPDCVADRRRGRCDRTPNRRWDSRCSSYAYDLFNRIQRIFNRPE